MYAILDKKGGIVLKDVMNSIGIYVNKTVSQNPDSMISLHAHDFHELIKAQCCYAFKCSVGVTLVAYTVDNVTALVTELFYHAWDNIYIILQVCIN